ncbi:MAG: GC-type dockerin domain-anchored protein, partial [Phycisphaerales bacterium JB060]
DNGDSMTADAGAEVVGTFDSTSGDGAIIVANGDATLFNGFDYDSMTDGEIRDLLAAQLGWLGTGGGDCYADFDGDGSLTLFDFLAFQNAFDSGDLAADCDEDGILTLFDFLCFQNAFDAGCE